MDKIIILISGIGVIGLIYWFFFGKKDEAVMAGSSINILVDGGYSPEKIKIQNGKTTKLIFKRTDPNSCLEEIIIPDFKVKEYLPLNEEIEIAITPKKTGEYETHCGMNMFHGKIIVV